MSHVGVVALVFVSLLGAHIAESAGYVDLVGGQEPANDPALSTKLTVTSLAYVRNQPDVATINTGISVLQVRRQRLRLPFAGCSIGWALLWASAVIR